MASKANKLRSQDECDEIVTSEVRAQELASVYPVEDVSAAQASDLRRLLVEKASRQIEALKLYEPMPLQQEFHRSMARTRIVIGSNRSGKTLATCKEVAGAVCGLDPKYPARDGRCYCVAFDLKEVAEVMWPKLGKAGAFKIIRDQETQQWRAYRPWCPADKDRKREAKPAPPLIPPRMIEDMAWENKKAGVPSRIKLTTGWTILILSSQGKPPHGADVDLVLLDEEMQDEEWVSEMQARLIDRGGRLIWSATPQLGTDQLYELHERAEKERNEADPAVQEFSLYIAENPHIGDAEKKEFAEGLSYEQYRVRYEGEFAVASFKVYPEFSMGLHGTSLKDFPNADIPDDWTRYAVIDPGHQVCAVLFAAVPPPAFGDYVYLYDELYVKECHADLLAERFAAKAIGQQFQAFLIDAHMSLHTELGVGKSVGQQYSEALRRLKVSSIATGDGFIMGSDDILAGVSAVHTLMRIRSDGTTRLKVVENRLQNFEYEIKRYLNKRENRQVTDRPNQKRRNHLMDTLRYLAMFNPRYVAPPKRKPKAGGAYAAFQEKSKRRKKNTPGYIRLGPGQPALSR